MLLKITKITDDNTTPREARVENHSRRFAGEKYASQRSIKRDPSDPKRHPSDRKRRPFKRYADRRRHPLGGK